MYTNLEINLVKKAFKLPEDQATRMLQNGQITMLSFDQVLANIAECITNDLNSVGYGFLRHYSDTLTLSMYEEYKNFNMGANLINELDLDIDQIAYTAIKFFGVAYFYNLDRDQVKIFKTASKFGAVIGYF